MTISEGLPNAPAPIEGFWSIEVVGKTFDVPRQRFVCHARGDLHANAMAKLMMGQTRSSLGYDIVRLQQPPGEAASLTLGQYMPERLPQRP